MPPDQQQQLKAHAAAIVAILLADAKAKHPERLDTLEGIELTVCQQIQAHVNPHIGVFYRRGQRHHGRKTPHLNQHFGGFGVDDSPSPSLPRGTELDTPRGLGNGDWVSRGYAV
ncbi:MAG: hypothetical protein RLZZ597_425 [Cyanobacteriota bacterium]|jgi:hypothetical protein